MGVYDVYILCDECFDFHRIGTGITLEDGPANKQSIDEAYAGKKLPSDIASLLNNDFQCPNTGKRIVEKDNSQVFLIPVVFI
jgi:hypothetical protein